jgi:SAM-dependent methyltransferase
MRGEGTYQFGEDAEQEAGRLAAVERAFDPVSKCLVLGAGVRPGWRCWEVAAGNGSLARWLCGVVGPEGKVLATDLNERGFEAGDTGVEFLRHDVTTDPTPADGFDLVHARFLLEHLGDPRGVIDRLRDALRPGGVLVLEDSAGLRIDVTPTSTTFDGLAEAWELAASTVGWDASYGSRLMSDLHSAGLSDLRGHEYRQLAPGGEAWVHVAAGLERLRDPLVEHGISRAELQRAVECLGDPARLITGPPVVVATGRR